MVLICIIFSVAGTAGAILTCPLEVVKTRLQSSNSGFVQKNPEPAANGIASSGAATAGKAQPTARLVVPDVARVGGTGTVPLATQLRQQQMQQQLPQVSSQQQQGRMMLRHCATSATAVSPKAPPPLPPTMGVWQCLK